MEVYLSLELTLTFRYPSPLSSCTTVTWWHAENTITMVGLSDDTPLLASSATGVLGHKGEYYQGQLLPFVNSTARLFASFRNRFIQGTGSVSLISRMLSINIHIWRQHTDMSLPNCIIYPLIGYANSLKKRASLRRFSANTTVAEIPFRRT